MAGAFAALFCVVVSALVVVSMHDREARQGQEQITESIDRMVYHVKEGVFPKTLVTSEDEVIQVVNPQGRVVTATREITGKPPMATFHAPADQLRAQRTLCPPAGLKGCMTVVGYKVLQPDGVWTIYTAIPVIPWYVSSTLAIFLGVVSLLIIAMTALVAFRAVGRTLAPVEAIRVELDEIRALDLDRRVPVPKNQDEIRTLAESVNTTLDRLEAAYDQLRRFTSDASHEVRSPLTAIRAQVEEALMRPAETDWPQVGRAVLDAVERLQALVTDLLILARLDAGASVPCIPTDLAQLVNAELNRRNSTVTVVRDLPEGVFAQCDQTRITRLLSNLMDNAERHATSQVTVVVRADESSVVLKVADDGAGIAAEAREVVFKRFTRLDTSRTRGTGGTGLGLAIARQIAEVHGGTLTAEDGEQGACFVLRLPRRDPPRLLPATDTEAARQAD